MSESSLRVVTPHESVAEFIHSFCRVVDQQHMLVSLRRPRPQGSTVRFSVRLASGHPVFEGVGRVVDVHARRGSELVGTKIELVSLEAESRTMHVCLMMARTAGSEPSSAPMRVPPPRPAPGPVVRPLTSAEPSGSGFSQPAATLPEGGTTGREKLLFAFLVLLLSFGAASMLGGMP